MISIEDDECNNNSNHKATESKKNETLRSTPSTETDLAVDQLHASEKLIAELNETWEQKLKRTEEIRAASFSVFAEMGVAVKPGETLNILILTQKFY